MTLRSFGSVTDMAGSFPFGDIGFTSAMRDKLIDDFLNFKLDAAFIPAPAERMSIQNSLVLYAPMVSGQEETFSNRHNLRLKVMKWIDQAFFFSVLEHCNIDYNLVLIRPSFLMAQNKSNTLDFGHLWRNNGYPTGLTHHTFVCKS